MNKNMIIAVTLSMLFLILWTKFYRVPQYQQIRNEQLEIEKKIDVHNVTKKTPAEMEVKTVTISLEKAKITFTSRGGAIKNYIIAGNTTELDLVFENGSFFETYPDIPAQLTRKKNSLISVQNIDGILLRKTYFFNDSNLEGLEIATINTGARDTIFDLKLKISDGLGADESEKKENIDLNSIKVLTNKQPTSIKSGTVSLKGSKWIANDNRYFLLALIPATAFEQESIEVLPKTKTKPPAAFLTSKITLKSAQKYLASYRLIIGGKSYGELKKLSAGLERTVDFGLVGGLARFFLSALTLINRFTGNYGWSIILLSLAIQIITLPLSIKSLKATAQMRRLQPLLKEIQAKFKNDPKRMNVEVMNLYRTHHVNPLSGCLPLLLQLPIFWALFNTLRNAFELRNASWILWIKDLSAKDPYYVLPLLMGAGMFVQQMMSGATSDPQSKMMGYLFPIVFTFMFLNFPSGIVLYWLTNSILTILMQLLVIEKEVIKEHHHK